MLTKLATSWRECLKIHPVAADFPRMSPDEFKALTEDIKKNGQRVPIAIIERARRRPDGTFHVSDPPLQEILDGISRLDALQAAGVAVIGKDGQLHKQVLRTVVDADEVDPVAYVISANIHRRHLTGEQKRELIAKLIKATPEKSDRQIAETVKASPTTVGTVRAKMEATGDVSKLDTRRDRRGREQPSSKPRTGLLKWKIDGNEARAAAPVDLDAFAIEGAIYTVMASKKLRRKGQPKFFHVGLLTEVGHQSIGGTKRTLSAAQRFCEDHFRAWRRRAAIPHTESAADSAPPRDDIGPASTSEAERLRVYVEKLEADKRRLEIKVAGLESEIEELRGKLATGTGGDTSISEFQAAHKRWEEAFETQRGIIARLENENATLRARVVAPPADPSDMPPIPAFLQRAAP
jgi:hypothetical protein